METINLLRVLMYSNYAISLIISLSSLIAKKYSPIRYTAAMTTWGIGFGIFISNLIIQYH